MRVLRVAGVTYSEQVPSLELLSVQHQRALPLALREWLNSGRVSPLDRPWIVVPSAAMRQRVDWDLADAQGMSEPISSNMRDLFPEEFVDTIETTVSR